MSKREQLEKMLEASPDDEFLKYALAMACSSEGDEEEAVRRLALITDGNPDNVSAWFQQAQILARMGESEDAAEVARNGIEAARKDGRFSRRSRDDRVSRPFVNLDCL